MKINLADMPGLVIDPLDTGEALAADLNLRVVEAERKTGLRDLLVPTSAPRDFLVASTAPRDLLVPPARDLLVPATAEAGGEANKELLVAPSSTASKELLVPATNTISLQHGMK